MDAFGFFETEDENEAVLTGIASVLGHRGRFCLKVVNGEPVLNHFRSRDREERDGSVVTISRTLSLHPPRMTEQIAVSGSRGKGDYKRSQRLYRAEEMRSMLERSGLSIVGIFADADDTAFEPAISKTMWLVAERKER